MDEYTQKIFTWLSELQTKHVNEIEASAPRYEAERDLKFNNPIHLN